VLAFLISFLDLEKMDTLSNLRTFLLVARYGGFSEAARKLNVVPSVVAKRIAQIEETMGAKLFERSTRVVTLTEAGKRLLARAPSLVAGFDDMLSSVRKEDSELEGLIRVMAPTSFTVSKLGPIFTSFIHRHPGVKIDISLADKSVNPLEEGIDIAISGRSATYEGVMDIPLAPVRPILCVSPEYLSEIESDIENPRDIGNLACLTFRPSGDVWGFNSENGVVYVEVTSRLTADDNHTLLNAALGGLGPAILPGYICREYLDAGRLLELLPNNRPLDYWFRAYIPRRRHTTPRVKALVDHLVASMGEPNHDTLLQSPR